MLQAGRDDEAVGWLHQAAALRLSHPFLALSLWRQGKSAAARSILASVHLTEEQWAALVACEPQLEEVLGSGNDG